MPGYHTGPGCHLGYLTGARHSHLDSAGYSLDQKAAAKGEALTPDGVASWVAGRRALAPGADQPGDLPVCARHVHAGSRAAGAGHGTGSSGRRMTWPAAGRMCCTANTPSSSARGLTCAALRIPGRILETPTPLGKIDEGFMRQSIEAYAVAV